MTRAARQAPAVGAVDSDGTTPWAAGRIGPGRRHRLLFGWSYEDEQVELDAFGPPGRVLVIAASGETAAACAAAGHHVLAVDINPLQVEYARQRLDGGEPRVGDAERGIAAGRWALGRAVPAWRPERVIDGLLTRPADVAARYWSERMDRFPVPALFAAALRPQAAVLRLLRTSFSSFIPARLDQRLRQRIAVGLAENGATDNRFAWRLLAGRELPGWRPPVPAGGGSISWSVGDVVRVLEEQPPGSLTGLSLSNVADGADDRFTARLLAAARRAVAPGGAVVSRSFADGARDAADASLLWGEVRVLRL